MAKYIRPVNYPVSKGGSFADHVNRVPTSKNPGVDYACPMGTPILAPAGGRIADVDHDPSGSGGKMFALDTYDGEGGDFLHLDSIVVVGGQYVNQGQVLAYSGNTGDSSGPHLHLAWRLKQGSHYLNSGNVDFEQLFLNQPAGGGGTPIGGDQGEDDMALLDGGYIAEQSGSTFVRGMIFGPGVPGGVIVKPADKIAELQAMGNLAGVRVFDSAGKGVRIGAPIKYVQKGTGEFDATVDLAKEIFG